jgi:hypothetical protein
MRERVDADAAQAPRTGEVMPDETVNVLVLVRASNFRPIGDLTPEREQWLRDYSAALERAHHDWARRPLTDWRVLR